MAMRRSAASEAGRTQPIPTPARAKYSRTRAAADPPGLIAQLADLQARIDRLEKQRDNGHAGSAHPEADSGSDRLALVIEKLEAILGAQQDLRADVAVLENDVPRLEDELRRALEDIQ